MHLVLALGLILSSLLLQPACERLAAQTEPAAASAPDASAAPDKTSQPAAREVPLRKGTDWDAPYDLTPSERDRLAHKNKDSVVQELFDDAKVPFPPRQLLLRGFKKEKELEVWAAAKKSGPLTHIATYEICFMSGHEGPKRKQGDLQVPEGFYVVDVFNKGSDFFLSLGLNYPNDYDRRLKRTGSAIMIHGACVSIGCLAMTDERIQEIWVMANGARSKGATVQVHLFPGRDLQSFIDGTSEQWLKEFWTNLKEGYDLFERDHVLPRVSVSREPRYLFR